MKKYFLGFFMSALIASGLSAVSLDQNTLKIDFEAYKTSEMVGVSGTFKTVEYKWRKNAKTLGEYLKGARASIDPFSAFMGEGNDEITQNVTKVFFNSLMEKNDKIKVQFVEVVEGENKGVISARVSINKKSTIIPLTYTIENNKLEAKGQLDLHTFKNGAKALKDLSDAAAGHGKISWPLVDIKFSATILP